jgi:predicted regulator of Ras-like GTPase activity (Roadblock/LC7/MglB family)
VTKADRLAEVLDDFLGVSTEAEAAAVVSSDGLPMASALPPHVEEDRLAAMSAALLTLGERAAEGLGRGELGQVFIEGKDGYVVLMAAGPHAVLVAITSRRAKVGLVLFEMRRAAQDIADVMAESVQSAESDMPEPPEPPMRAPEPVPAAETESSMPSWQ